MILRLALVAAMLALFALAQSVIEPNALYKAASPSVVLIEATGTDGKPLKAGGGFFITSDGRLLTNYHVISNSARATVRLANGAAYDGVEVLGVDEAKDIALLKVRASDLPVVSLGKSSTTEIGEKIYSISNPLGFLQNTFSEGLISGVRELNGYRLFQITAPVSHGSSGGPIFDHFGQVIAITVGNIPGGQNLNFGIPIDYARALFETENPRPLSSLGDGASDNSVTNPKVGVRHNSEAGSDGTGDITGSYTGKMCNTTFGVCSDFSLSIWQAGDRLSGCIDIRRPLHGSGSVTGKMADSEIVLYSESYHSLVRFQMRLDGQWRGNGAFNGLYRVFSPSLQDGEFWTDRITSSVPDNSADTASCLKGIKSLWRH